MRLATRFSLVIFALTLLFAVTSHQIVVRVLEDRLEKGQEEWVGVLMSAIAEGVAIDTINNDVLAAKERLVNLVRREAVISYAYIVDFQGEIFTHTFKAGFPKAFADMSHDLRIEDHSVRYETSAGPVLDVSYPLIEGMSGHLHVGINYEQIKGLLAKTRQDLLLVALAIGATGLLMALWLGNRISRPIALLANWVKDYGSGKAVGSVKLEQPDLEVKELARSFDHMVQEQNKAQKELNEHREHLEELVDIRTEELRVARDQALEATRAKSDFLASMSHELRTPLNSIIGFTGILKDGMAGPINDEQGKQLTMVYGSAKHLLELINDILDLSKVEAGRIDVVKEDFELGDLLTELSELMQPQAHAKGLQLTLEEIPSLTLHTDRGKLRQTMLNLIGNALKFTEQGRVSVSAKRHEGGLQIHVTDTGIGILESHQQRVFDSFRQVDMSDDRKHEGTGLGLAISRKFMHLLGGDIRLESEFGKGSTFSVVLPAKVILSEPIQSVPPTLSSRSENAPIRGVGQGHLVMVVDDQRDAQELLSNYLQSGGYRVALCADGRKAVEMARQVRPFAITLDIIMPNQDGWQTLAQLKQDPETSDIPVIIISSLDEKNLGMSLGAVDYLEKPVDKGALFKSIQTLEFENRDILLVEDRIQDAEMLKAMLEPEGYQVRQASSGALALKLLEVYRPGLILLDLMMPGISGFEVIRHVRNNPDTQDIPIIVVSAKSLSEAEQDYLRANVQDLLMKGAFSRQQMLDDVGRFLTKVHSEKVGEETS